MRFARSGRSSRLCPMVRRAGEDMRLFAAASVGLLMLVVRPAAQQIQQPPPEQHAGTYSQADIQAGSVVYSAQCLQCHGPNGDRISGVDLRSGRFRNATSDDDLRRIITNGLPGTSMIGQRIESAQLTAREAEIARLVTVGLPNKEIARRLDVTEGTVKIHLHNIFRKLQVPNRTSLAGLAFRWQQD